MGIVPAFGGGRLAKPVGGGSDTAAGDPAGDPAGDLAGDGGTVPAGDCIAGCGPGGALAVPVTGAAGLGMGAGR